MAEFLTALQWLRLLVAQYRRRSNMGGGIGRQARGLEESKRAGGIAEQGREGCAGCRYYVATRGACHVLPPVQQRGNSYPWPAVQPGDWCGAFSSVFSDEA